MADNNTQTTPSSSGPSSSGQGAGASSQSANGAGSGASDSAAKIASSGGATADLGAIKNIGNELLGAVRDRVDSVLTEQKTRAADEIESVAKTVHSVAKTVEESGQGAIAEYAEEAAGQIDQFAERIRKDSWRELASDVEGLARRWPTAFVASAVALGFFAGRFMLASRPSSGAGGQAAGGAINSGSRAGTRPGAVIEPTRSREGQAGYGASSGTEKH